MKIGIYNLEPKVNNTAMMQVSQYHKEKGALVEIYNHLERYDKIYAFSIFNYTDKGYVTKNMIKGGSGFDVNSKLPKEIEECDYDYSIFPNCKTSYVWFSKGCIRKCPFCIVWKKEGNIKSVNPKKLNPKGEYISVMDNNFFANPKWREAIKQLIKWDQPIDFNSGIDVRLFNKEQGEALQKLKIYNYLHLAWDNPNEYLIPKFKELIKYIKPYKIMVYVLIGYWSDRAQDLERVMALKQLGVDPFVMPYDKFDKYQRDFARWCNRKSIFETCEWKDYNKKKKDL